MKIRLELIECFIKQKFSKCQTHCLMLYITLFFGEGTHFNNNENNEKNIQKKKKQKTKIRIAKSAAKRINSVA